MICYVKTNPKLVIKTCIKIFTNEILIVPKEINRLLEKLSFLEYNRKVYCFINVLKLNCHGCLQKTIFWFYIPNFVPNFVALAMYTGE